MAANQELPAVRVGPRGVARAQDGHPWIFRTDVREEPPPAALVASLDCVRVVDERGRALGTALYAPPPAAIALRLYARGSEPALFDDALLAARLAEAVARRRELGGGEVPPLCRLVHGEADRLPGLFVDRYGDAVVLQTGTGAMDRREASVAAILARQLGLRLVVARDDGSVRDHEGLSRRKGVLLGGGSTVARVREGEATLELDLLEDAKTGGFLDQRENHERAAALARGQALDAFTYHGGFALALARGAEHVLAFDQDARAVQRAQKNAQLSGLANVDVQVADAFVALRELERSGRIFDVVVVDPPALAKRRAGLPPVLREYQELNLRAMRLTAPGGWLVTCSCSGKVTPELFGEMLVKAGRDAHREVQVVERRGAGRDHPVLLGVPETDYLKCWILRVL